MNPWRIHSIQCAGESVPFDSTRRYAVAASAVREIVDLTEPTAYADKAPTVEYTLANDETQRGERGYIVWNWEPTYTLYIDTSYRTNNEPVAN